MTLRIAQKVAYHKPEEVQAAAEQALRVADELDLSDEDRAVLLPHFLNALLQSHLQLEEVGAASALGLRG